MLLQIIHYIEVNGAIRMVKSRAIPPMSADMRAPTIKDLTPSFDMSLRLTLNPTPAKHSPRRNLRTTSFNTDLTFIQSNPSVNRD